MMMFAAQLGQVWAFVNSPGARSVGAATVAAQLSCRLRVKIS